MKHRTYIKGLRTPTDRVPVNIYVEANCDLCPHLSEHVEGGAFECIPIKEALRGFEYDRRADMLPGRPLTVAEAHRLAAESQLKDSTI